MQRRPATRQEARLQSQQRLRWERMRVAIRCALYPDRPGLLQAYLGLGRWLVRYAGVDDALAQARMLQVLVDASSDGALPRPWRNACLVHAERPALRLARLWSVAEPARLARLQTDLAKARAGSCGL